MDGVSVLAGAALVAVGFGLSTTVRGRSTPARPTRALVQPHAAPAAKAGADPTSLTFTAVPPTHLPTFAAVAGLDELKSDVQRTVGLLMQHPKEAEQYRIQWNGLLLHGPPGVGKSFITRAIAGELKLNLVAVTTADLLSEYPGEGAQRVQQAFAFAKAHEPALLFFDEFDAIAQSRNDNDNSANRDTLLQLLQSVEAARADRQLLVVAATNDVDALDPAIIRPGRFDRHVRLDLPDAAARSQLFKVALAGRPTDSSIDVDDLASRTQGRTPAAITAIVDAAALAAFRKAAGTSKVVRITMGDLVDAAEHTGGRDRPTVEDWSWERLVLSADTLAELKQIQQMVQDPSSCRKLGIEPPSALLTGPPGTGKTTIAKVLAAESACSFYPVSAGSVTSQWVGESEHLIARLFNRARDNAPSIVFIDEIDAIASARGKLGAYDRQLDQLLAEMDGMSQRGGVFVVGATNRPAQLDPAILRGGRLSRRIEIPLPDAAARHAILQSLTAKMPLHDVDLDQLTTDTEGFSGADLKALCQQAAVEAMVRGGSSASSAGPITGDDFLAALLDDEPHPHHPKRAEPLRAPDKDGH